MHLIVNCVFYEFILMVFFLFMNSSVYLLIVPGAKLREIIGGVDNHNLPTKTISVEPSMPRKISLEFYQKTLASTIDVPTS